MTSANYQEFIGNLENALIQRQLVIKDYSSASKSLPFSIAGVSLSPLIHNGELWGEQHYKIKLKDYYTLKLQWFETTNGTQGPADSWFYMSMINEDALIPDSCKVAQASHYYVKEGFSFNWSSRNLGYLLDSLILQTKEIAELKLEEYAQITESIAQTLSLIPLKGRILTHKSYLYELNFSAIQEVIQKPSSSFVIFPIKEILFDQSPLAHNFEFYWEPLSKNLHVRYFMSYMNPNSFVMYKAKQEATERFYRFKKEKNSAFDITELTNNLLSQVTASQLCL